MFGVEVDQLDAEVEGLVVHHKAGTALLHTLSCLPK